VAATAVVEPVSRCAVSSSASAVSASPKLQIVCADKRAGTTGFRAAQAASLDLSRRRVQGPDEREGSLVSRAVVGCIEPLDERVELADELGRLLRREVGDRAAEAELSVVAVRSVSDRLDRAELPRRGSFALVGPCPILRLQARPDGPRPSRR